MDQTVDEKYYLVKKAQELIDENYCRRIGLSEVSSLLYVSPGYLCKLFKEKTGSNFTTYLNGVRIENSKMLLVDKSAKCYQVARCVGYENSAYFNRTFKKLTGVTPRQYKMMCCEERNEVY